MKNKTIKIFGKTLTLTMLIGIASSSNAQWSAANPTVLTSGYTVQGSSTTGGALGITTLSGTLTIGPQNTTYCQFYTNATQYYFDHQLSLANGYITSYEANNLTLATGIASSASSTPRITILQSNGNIGIGTTSPAEKLDVSGADSYGTVAMFRNLAYNFVVGDNLLGSSYSALTQTHDNGIFWTDGLGTAGINSASGFVIAPWQNSNNGIRIDGTNGNFWVGRSTVSATLGSCGEASSLGYATSYVGFNASRLSSGWATNGDGSSNGGAAIYGDVGGDICFATIPKTGGGNQISINDVTVGNNTIMKIGSNGKVIIGNPFGSTAIYTANVNTWGLSYTLLVAGGIITDQVKVASVNSANWSDYVFANDYKLKSLNELEQFYKENKHLPDVPSAKDVKDSGVDLVQMDATLLKKIEELTLYIVQQQKQIQEMQTKMDALSGKK
ncbi:MAG TPA: hypothetical protein VK890_03170 [Bacteroidia bacterium]|jgi:hypothetical protein|nr:hypothetical protein [Bacteroidia bacterium]